MGPRRLRAADRVSTAIAKSRWWPAKVSTSGMVVDMMMSAPDFQTVRDEFGPPRPNWIAVELEASARLRHEEEQAQTKERAVDKMKKDLQ